MNDLPKLKPYTVTNHGGLYRIAFNGVEQPDILPGDRAAAHQATLLNDAFVKGVEVERARSTDLEAIGLLRSLASIVVGEFGSPDYDDAHRYSLVAKQACELCDRLTSDHLVTSADMEAAINEPVKMDLLAPPSPIYLIADKEPVFSPGCWLWTCVRTAPFRWVHYGGNSTGHFVAKSWSEMPKWARACATHWSPDAPNPPQAIPA